MKPTKINFLKEKYKGRIVDNDGIIPEDMPAVLLLAQDKHTPSLMFTYAKMLDDDGDVIGAEKARKDAFTILWYQKTTNRVKKPD